MSVLSFRRRMKRITTAMTRARPQITPATTAKMLVGSLFEAAAVVVAAGVPEDVADTPSAAAAVVADMSSVTVTKASWISKLATTGTTAGVVGEGFLVSSAFLVSAACVAAAVVAAVFSGVFAADFAGVLAAPPP